jgi:hypothetical protein
MVKRMNKKVNIYIIVLLLIIICVIIYNMYMKNVSIRLSEVPKVETFSEPPSPTIIVTPPSPKNDVIERSPKEINATDRFWNPLRYPYRSDYFYDQGWYSSNNALTGYPSNNLPFQVMGGGRRMAPTIGGSEIPIANPTVPINIAEAPIAPINITTRGPRGIPQQLGVIYKVNGDHNTYLPLFGMKEYPNSDSYKYYTAIGNNSQVKVPLITKYRNQPLGDNDEVMIKGDPHRYRVTLYESDFPQYIGYI